MGPGGPPKPGAPISPWKKRQIKDVKFYFYVQVLKSCVTLTRGPDDPGKPRGPLTPGSPYTSFIVQSFRISLRMDFVMKSSKSPLFLLCSQGPRQSLGLLCFPVHTMIHKVNKSKCNNNFD